MRPMLSAKSTSPVKRVLSMRYNTLPSLCPGAKTALIVNGCNLIISSSVSSWKFANEFGVATSTPAKTPRIRLISPVLSSFRVAGWQ